MAETGDRSQSTQIGPGPDAGLPPGGAETFQAYQPLSLLSLAGFGLAVFSALIVCMGGWAPLILNHWLAFLFLVLLTPAVAALVCLLMGVTQPLRVLKVAGFALAGVLTVLGLGGLLAYSGSDPWLLPMWLLVLPVAALLLAWVGRSQVLRSEDALSGLGLSNWAVGIVAVFGLLYVAYYAATVVAVRQQSAAFAEEWLKRLQKGDVAWAFALTQPPEQRPAENADLRKELELLFNFPGPNNVGIFTEFGTKDYVRLLQSAAGDAKVTPVGLQDWKYENNVYQATYRYHITSAVCAFDVDVAVRSQENKQDKSKGRQWFVDGRSSGRTSAVEFTPEGMALSEKLTPGREFITAWLDKWYRGKDDAGADNEAYLQTLPAARRPEAAARQLLGPVALWADPERQSYHKGGLIEADPKTFFVSKTPTLTAEQHREVVIDALRKSFQPGEDRPEKAGVVTTAGFPLFQSVPGGKRLLYDMHFAFKPGRLGERPVDVDARVVLDCPDHDGAPKQRPFQIVQIQLLRARAEIPQGLGGPPGPQKMPPPN
jgi:hypothetical protein